MNSECSPPPCGEGRVGSFRVSLSSCFRIDSPPYPSPTRGEENRQRPPRMPKPGDPLQDRHRRGIFRRPARSRGGSRAPRCARRDGARNARRAHRRLRPPRPHGRPAPRLQRASRRRMRALLPACRAAGTVIVTNMGAANPRAAAEANARHRARAGPQGLKIACIEGDDVAAIVPPTQNFMDEPGTLADVGMADRGHERLSRRRRDSAGAQRRRRRDRRRAAAPIRRCIWRR